MEIMRKKLFTVFLAISTAFNATADEGMWLPSLISERIGDMQAKGCHLSSEDIYSINQASLKDAVVLFGRGCTGEVVSKNGLLFTNHHCGYGAIQRLSSVEHDYLKDGFWAMTAKEELPCPGITVSFLERMEDVTERVLEGYTEGKSESVRDSIIKVNSEKLIADATSEGNGLRASVEALYYGNQYFIFVYREYTDLRLVGAPPSSIGKFGGDTDNWVWPRHTGDFSIFRIYAGKDNMPAAYNEENIPYTPKQFFKVSAKGVKEGDFTFVYGFPGRTSEYVISDQVRLTAQVQDPIRVSLRTLVLNTMKKYMSQDQAIRIMYSARQASVANGWKKWQGEIKGLEKNNIVSQKEAYEKAFSQWASGTRYESILDSLHAVYEEYSSTCFASEYIREAVEYPDLTFKLPAAYLKAREKGKAAESVEGMYRYHHLPIDRETFVLLMTEYEKNAPPAYKPDYYRSQIQRYKGDFAAWADDIFASSVFSSPEKLKAAIAKGNSKIIDKDPAMLLYRAFEPLSKQTRTKVSMLEEKIRLLNREYMRAQMEFTPDRNFYPDANLTLRVAYGSIAGYTPMDAVYYTPQSSLEGVIQKDNPDIFDYNIPQSLRDIYSARDFGPYTDANGSVPVCFIATNHTTGGNSGSPVINADGELIGLNFDRVWEGTMSDLAFDPSICRNISLDVRYVLFIIDKLAHCQRLLDEMDIVWNE